MARGRKKLAESEKSVVFRVKVPRQIAEQLFQQVAKEAEASKQELKPEDVILSSLIYYLTREKYQETKETKQA